MDTNAATALYYQPKADAYDERGVKLPAGKAVKINAANRAWFELCAARGDGAITAAAGNATPPTPNNPPAAAARRGGNAKKENE